MTAEEVSRVLTCFRKNLVGRGMNISDRRAKIIDVQLEEGSGSIIWITEGDFARVTLCTALGPALWLVYPSSGAGAACPEPTVEGLVLSQEIKRTLAEI